MTSRRTIPMLLLAGIAAFGGSPAPLHAANGGRTFSAAVKRNLDEEARLIVNLLQNHHYSGRAFRDIENREMIERFLEELDPQHYVFSQADIDAVQRRFGRTLKSVYVYKGDMQPAQEIYALLIERAQRRFDWIDERLTRPFDLTRSELVSPSDLERAADAVSEDRRWELRLTNELIEAMLAGRDEAEAIDLLARHYRKVRRYGAGLDPYEVRALFLDSIIRSFDPRSGYFSADSSREFALEMAGAVTGIGVDVVKEDGRCIIDRVHPGGPADLHSDLQPGDELLDIGDEGGQTLPVEGMRLREITDRLRGADDTRVTLRYRRNAESTPVEVMITRARVTLILRRAVGSVHVLAAAGGASRRVGVIAFPSFYNSEEAEGASVAADVSELLGRMTSEGIDGVVIDLRGNPGGSMEEAVKLCGLFVRTGMAAWSRQQTGEVTPYPIEPAAATYDGPLVVLTSPDSASASELFSGAMQTHSRALVLGGESTLGKGTVQNHIPLEQLQAGGPQRDWGTLRLTHAMFNRPDGSPIQQTGILSDVVLPLRAAPGTERDSELEHSLPATPMQVPAVEPQPGGARIPAGGALAASLAARVAENLAALPEWRLWLDEMEHFFREDEGPLSLSLEARRAEHDAWIRKAQALADERRRLRTAAAHAIEPVDLESTAAAKLAHNERMRALLAGREARPFVRLEGGGFVVETTHGHLRRLRWSSFRFANYTGFAGELAEAFNTGAGTALDGEELALILSELLLLERPDDAAVREVFERHAPEGTGAAPVQAGIDAVLARILEIDPDLRAERWTFDIPLREAVRTAAAWAGAASDDVRAP